MTAIIEIEKLTKTYGSHRGIVDVDLVVNEGEAVGFLGPNGAGKSSTMRMIGCVSPVTSGELSLFGLDPAEHGPAIRARIGVVPQEDTLDQELTVRDNLIVYARYFGIPRSVSRPRVDQLLDFVQLSERATSKVEPLSGGMKRRLTIARSLISRPEILLLDEPTTGLDPQARHLLWDRLFRLKRSGVTLVLTQHAIPHGQGLIGVSFYLTDGSAALDFYSYATLLLAIGLLGISVLFVRRLGPALTVIPWIVFYLSVRSQDGYFLLMSPLWFAALATAPPSAFERAWQPRLRLPRLAQVSSPQPGRWARGAPGHVALAGLMLTPSLLCATVAVASDEPLELTIVSTRAYGAHEAGIWQITVEAVNDDTVALAPRFTISTNPNVTAFWRATGGPNILAPHEHATYVLTATNPSGYTPGPNGYLYLRAVTDRPMTVSTVRIPVD
jgi:ABC-type Na+ transport system ATPase subunit NatA